MPASEQAVGAIGKLREMDAKEAWAMAQMDGRQALLHSFYRSERAWAVLSDGNPVGVFGVNSVSNQPDKGCPWFLASDGINEVWGSLLRQARDYVFGPMMENYEMLCNYVWVENKASVRWLKWVGFTLEEPVPVGINQELFHLFWARR